MESKRVLCIDDLGLPKEANIVKGEEYTVIQSFINSYDQVVYILAKVKNHGYTKYGLPWIGYNSKRFRDINTTEEEKREINYMLN